MRRITFITGNKKKLEEVRMIIGSCLSTVDLVAHPLDLPELQGESEDVAKEKCRLAAKQIDGPVLVEDTSLCFNALNGLPGPYVKWFLEKTGHEGLNNLLAAYSDKSAYAQCIFALSWSKSSEPLLFIGRTYGTIVPAKSASIDFFGWDPIFQPEGHDLTYAQMTKEEKNKISHRSRALAELTKHLESR